MKAIIKPLEGIVFDNKEITLGMSKKDVIRLLGEADVCERFYYFDSELAIDFDENDTVEFIEFLGGKHGNIKPFIYEIPAFDSSADELVEILKAHNSGRIKDDEDGYAYSFNKIGIRIYRESTPEGAREVIEELKADGEYDQETADAEMELANHWATIGLGKENYYA